MSDIKRRKTTTADRVWEPASRRDPECESYWTSASVDKGSVNPKARHDDPVKRVSPALPPGRVGLVLDLIRDCLATYPKSEVDRVSRVSDVEIPLPKMRPAPGGRLN